MKAKYWIEIIVIRVLEGFINIFPSKIVEWLGLRLGDILWFFFPYRFSVAYHNLGVVFPEKTRKEKLKFLHKIYHHYGYVMATYFILHRNYFKKKLENVHHIDNPNYNEDFDKGNGILYAVFHYGHWEAFINYLTIKAYPFTGIYKIQKNPKTNDYFIKHREYFGDTIKHISSKEGIKSYENVLRENRMLGIAIDQNAHKRGIKVLFFNKEFSAPKGTAILHLLTGAPIYVSSMYMENGILYYKSKKLDLPAYSEKGDEAIKSIMTEVLKETEAQILKHPEQWLWFHKLWSGIYKAEIKRTWREYFL